MPGTRGAVPIPIQNGELDLTQHILNLLDEREPINTQTDFPHIPQAEIKAALDRLASRLLIQYDTRDKEQVLLTSEGQSLCDEGSHEYRVWDAVRQAGKLALKDLPFYEDDAWRAWRARARLITFVQSKVNPDTAKVGQGNAFKLKWIKKDGDALVLLMDEVEDKTQQLLQSVHQTKSLSDAKVLADLKKRKLVTTGKVISYTVHKGPKYAKEIPVEVTDLTADMLATGEWKTANFKPYNFKALGAPQNAGALHPLGKVRTEFRNIFFNLGFTEMPTNNFLESAFWCFDALFVPQQHPARDLQDTFYVSDPVRADKPREDPDFDRTMEEMEAGTTKLFASSETMKKPRDYEDYFNKIRAVHQDGAFGSIGYRAPWSADESLKLVLRTHTTATSTRVLHRLAENPRPARYFSIDRVFRNETVDATHLAEFHQIEGVIADWNLTLGGLQAFLGYFFEQIGISNLRFKPAYNPYTEPSMEVFGYHKGLGRWVEIGNSGMFRPEMLEPMGLPRDLVVYGFGLSLERPTMIKYGVSNIRDLLGHKVDLGFIETNAAVRLDRI